MSISFRRRSRTHNATSSLFVETLQKNLKFLRDSGSSGSTHSLDRVSQGSNEAPEQDTESYLNVSTIPHAGFANNEDWVGVQEAILSIFQGKKLTSVQRSDLYQIVKKLAHSELGPFIYDYYRNQLMPRGMRILRKDVNTYSEGLMKGLENIWNKFYMEILSDLKVALHPVKIKEHNIRQLTLLGFRDFVLLKTEIEDKFMESNKLDISPAIQQMLLVLQSVRICDPPTENYIRLERLVGRAIVPYLGYLGLYEGSSEPSVCSEHYGTVIKKSKQVTAELSRAPSLYQKRRPRQYLTSMKTLETVTEMKTFTDMKVLTLGKVSEMTQHERVQMGRQSVSPEDSPPVPIKLPANRGRQGRRHSCDVLMASQMQFEPNF